MIQAISLDTVFQKLLQIALSNLSKPWFDSLMRLALRAHRAECPNTGNDHRPQESGHLRKTGEHRAKADRSKRWGCSDARAVAQTRTQRVILGPLLGQRGNSSFGAFRKSHPRARCEGLRRKGRGKRSASANGNRGLDPPDREPLRGRRGRPATPIKVAIRQRMREIARLLAQLTRRER